ncbi:MAG: 3-phosphoshikimate 1-carboxyvinyltransferase [Acidimicrobiia bacterium]
MTLYRVTPARLPIDVQLRPPGSKSITIRALAAAALAEGTSEIGSPLEAEDTQAMRRAVSSFGAVVRDRVDPWSVEGVGGAPSSPDWKIDAGESGLTARIAIAIAALTSGLTVVTGRGRLPERPMSGLVEALESLGVETRPRDGRLPIEVVGRGSITGGEVKIDCSATSQFATALLLIAPLFDNPSRIRLEGLSGSWGYLEVTRRVIAAFGGHIKPCEGGFEVLPSGYQPARFDVEPDASAAAYPLVAAAITGGRVVIDGLGLDSAQPDITLVSRLEEMGCQITGAPDHLILQGPEELDPIEADMSGAPDAALALAVTCLFARGESRISGLGSLRFKESDRLAALADSFAALGAQARIEDEDLVVVPGSLVGAVLDSHGDHRIAMALSLVGLAVPGVAIARPEVVSKTWPEWWAVLERMAVPDTTLD